MNTGSECKLALETGIVSSIYIYKGDFTQICKLKYCLPSLLSENKYI